MCTLESKYQLHVWIIDRVMGNSGHCESMKKSHIVKKAQQLCIRIVARWGKSMLVTFHHWNKIPKETTWGSKYLKASTHGHWLLGPWMVKQNMAGTIPVAKWLIVLWTGGREWKGWRKRQTLQKHAPNSPPHGNLLGCECINELSHLNNLKSHLCNLKKHQDWLSSQKLMLY